MKHNLSACILLIGCLFFVANASFAQNSSTAPIKNPVLKTFLIERNIPGAGLLTAEQLKGISQKSCSVLKDMGPNIVWLQSYVTGDKIFCVYQAENETMLQDHAKKGGFPINSIMEINNNISPKTAE